MSIWLPIGLLSAIVLIVIILALAVFYVNNFNNGKL